MSRETHDCCDDGNGGRHAGSQIHPASAGRGGKALCWPTAGLAWPPRTRSTSYVQKQLGHPSKMSRKYQHRRDRFRVNLTKASGL